MVSKKHPYYELEKRRGTFFAIGMAITLFTVLTAMEWTTTTPIVKESPPLIITDDDDDIEVVITTREKKKVTPPKQKPQPQPDPEPVPEPEPDPDPEPEPEPEPELNHDSLFNPDEGDDGDNFDDDPVIPFVPIEDMPKFRNGQKDLLNYLAKNIKYPMMAKEAGVSGTVYVRFVVNKRGKVVDPEILRGIGSGCDKEALRVVSNMPKWTPGNQRGKKVSVRFTLPVKYELR